MQGLGWGLLVNDSQAEAINHGWSGEAKLVRKGRARGLKLLTPGLLYRMTVKPVAARLKPDFLAR